MCEVEGCAVPCPQMRGTWGNRSFVVGDGREKPEEQPQVLRLRSLRRPSLRMTNLWVRKGARGWGLCRPMSPNARDMGHPFICGGRWARKARRATTGPSTSVAAATFAQDDKSMAEKGCARLRVVPSHVPKCEGHGAPVHLWWAMGARSPRSNRRSFDFGRCGDLRSG
jgi:hypothetical protein